MLHQMRKIVTHKKQDSEFQRQLLLLMYELLQTAAGGLKALDAHVEAPRESALFQRYPLVLEEPKLLAFIVDNFRLMAMGKINAHELEGVLEQELEAIHDEMLQPAKSLQDRRGHAGLRHSGGRAGHRDGHEHRGRRRRRGEIAEHVGAAMVGTFIGIFFCYGLLDPLCNMMKQLVGEEGSTMECVKVVLVTHVAGKPPLLAIDAGRRLVQLNIKPSFAQLESWINALEDGGADKSKAKAGRPRAKAA
jgi:chemotaxis protein MotA